MLNDKLCIRIGKLKEHIPQKIGDAIARYEEYRFQESQGDAAEKAQAAADWSESVKWLLDSFGVSNTPSKNGKKMKSKEYTQLMEDLSYIRGVLESSPAQSDGEYDRVRAYIMKTISGVE